MGKFDFGQSVPKLPKNYGKVLFYETYFEESNINWRPLIWSKFMIIMKYGPKKWVSLVSGKAHDNYPKSKETCYFTKVTSKRVISTGNHLFGPNIR